MQSLWHWPIQIYVGLKLFSTFLSFYFVLNPHNSTFGCAGEARDEQLLEGFSSSYLADPKIKTTLYKYSMHAVFFFSLYC